MDDLEPDTTTRPARRLGGLSRRTAIGVTSAGLLIGGLGGGFLVGHAATPSTPAATPSASSGSPGTTTPPASGKFTPNEDPAHEAGESAQREAQEDAGQVPTVP